MARRPENRKSRGRSSEGPLDWLKQPNPPATEPPEAARPTLLGENPALLGDNPALLGDNPALLGEARPGPAAPDTGPLTLSRRAARAQREAEQARQAGQAGQAGQAKRANSADARQASSPDAALLAGPPPAPTLRRRRRNPLQQPEEPAAAPSPRRRQVAFWLTVAALLLGLWSATAFIDSGNFLIAGLAALSPMVAVFALPVIAVGVGSKHLVPTAIAVVAALLPWTLVAGYAVAGPGITTAGAQSTLRVMSVDGAQGQASATDIVQLARAYSANIVVVTELTSDLAHQLTVDGLNLLGTAQWVQVPANGINGIGLWSGQQIDDLQQINELSQPGVDGAIEAGTGNRIGITVVQLNGEPLRPGSSWHSDLTRLASRAAATTKPGLIVGNLNATPWQPAFRKLTGSGWRDAADVVGQGLRPTWPSWSPLPIAPLDHVLVSPGLGVSSADTANIGGTDHRALIVTLILPRAQNAGD